MTMVKEAPLGRADDPLRLATATAVFVLAIAIGIAVGAADQAGEAPAGDSGSPDEAHESEAREFLGGFNGFGSLFVALATILLGWAWTARPLLRPVAAVARLRIPLHVWTSIGALAMGLIHTAGLLSLDDARGWLSGAFSLAFMAALFATGWWRRWCIAHWGRRTWRWVHWELAVGAVLVGFEHWLLIELAR